MKQSLNYTELFELAKKGITNCKHLDGSICGICQFKIRSINLKIKKFQLEYEDFVHFIL